MYSYDKNYIAKRATELGFIRDTLEKVYRLADVLEYLNTSSILKDKLALKGGTAINLTVFNLPRLSVDIDLDYLGADSREEMLKNRETINLTLSKFMLASGYSLSPKTKNRFYCKKIFAPEPFILLKSCNYLLGKEVAYEH